MFLSLGFLFEIVFFLLFLKKISEVVSNFFWDRYNLENFLRGFFFLEEER